MIWRSLLVVTAFLVLGAHFLRDAHFFMTVACLTTPLLLLFRRRWARLAVQWALFAGTLVWLYTAYALAQQRWEAQEPWARMLVILTAVAALTATAAFTLNAASVKRRYP